jgi:hypothetical protein
MPSAPRRAWRCDSPQTFSGGVPPPSAQHRATPQHASCTVLSDRPSLAGYASRPRERLRAADVSPARSRGAIRIGIPVARFPILAVEVDATGKVVYLTGYGLA